MGVGVTGCATGPCDTTGSAAGVGDTDSALGVTARSAWDDGQQRFVRSIVKRS
jgi:hypothetical protein